LSEISSFSWNWFRRRKRREISIIRDWNSWGCGERKISQEEEGVGKHEI
jgi:hypothetical protein